jgi:hypothetical protein
VSTEREDLMILREIFLGVSLLGWLPAQARAQTLTPEAVQQVNAASQIRVRLASGERGTLYAPGVDSESLSYAGSRLVGSTGSLAQLPPTLPVAQIRLIQVPHGSHARLGSKIGAAVGCGLSLLGIAATSGDNWTFPTPEEAGFGIVALTVVGAGVGALIGSASPRWRTVYDAPAP